MEARDAPYDAHVPEQQSTRASGAIRNSLIIGISIAAWSIGAFAFYLIAGRILGPETYGLAAALQSVIIVGSTPIIALQWSIARITASNTGERRGAAMAVYRRAVIVGTASAFALACLASIVTVAISASHEGIPTVPLVLTYFSIVVMVPLLLALGTLQGEERYGTFAWSYAATGVLRAPLLVLLFLLPIGQVNATVLAVGVTFGIGAIWAMSATHRDLTAVGNHDQAVWRSFTRALPATGAGLAGIAMLTNVDVIAAKLALGGTEAGLFGAASVIAKSLMVVPAALTIVLLPRVAARESAGERTGSLLAAGILVMAATGILAMVLVYPLETTVIDIAFGSQYEAAAPLLIPFIGATTLLGALFILVNHHVARSDHRFVWAVGGLAVLQLVLLVFFSTSAQAIILIDAVVAGIGLVIHEMMYFRTDESMLRGAGAQFAAMFRRVARRNQGVA